MGKEINFPNLLTLIRLFLGPVIMYLIFQENNVVAMSLLVIAWATDVGDGYFARKYNLTTEFGKHFDRLVDKLLVGFVFFAILLKHDSTPWIWFTLAVVVGFVVMYRFVADKGIQVTKLGRFCLGVQLILLLVMTYGYVTNILLSVFFLSVLIPAADYVRLAASKRAVVEKKQKK